MEWVLSSWRSIKLEVIEIERTNKRAACSKEEEIEIGTANQRTEGGKKKRSNQSSAINEEEEIEMERTNQRVPFIKEEREIKRTNQRRT